MAKGKKKKVKLTKEEKAMRKVLAKKVAEELLRKERMNHLEREVQMTDANWLLLKRQFRQMLLKMQMPAIRHEMEVAWHGYESTFDRKDFVIDNLFNELDQRDDLRQIGLANQITSLSELMILGEKRLDQEHDAYNKKRDQLMSATETHRTAHEKEMNDMHIHFSLVCNAMNTRTEDLLLTMQSDYVTRLDDDKDKLNDQRKLLKGLLENQLDRAWRGMRNTLAEYEASAAQKRQRLAAVAARDARSSAVLERQEQHVIQLQATEEHMLWRLKHESPGNVLSGRLTEQRYFCVAYCALRHRLACNLRCDAKQLSHLAHVSNGTLERLQRLKKKAERMLTLAAICHRMETLPECIVPVPRKYAAASLPITKRTATVIGDAEEDEEELEVYEEQEPEILSSSSSGSSVPPDDAMSGFWRRAARADVQRADLLELREALRFENAALLRALRCCLRESDMFRSPPPLDPRICGDECTHSPPRTNSPPRCRPVVEAAHVYRKLSFS